MQIKVEEGRVLPVLWTATGRLLAAYLDPSDITPLLEPEFKAWNSEHPNQPLERTEVETVFAEIRESGMSSSLAAGGGKRTPMFSPVTLRRNSYVFDTLAVPLFDHLGKVSMALTFFGTERFALSGQRVRGDELVEVARAASRKLGYSAPEGSSIGLPPSASTRRSARG